MAVITCCDRLRGLHEPLSPTPIQVVNMIHRHDMQNSADLAATPILRRSYAPPRLTLLGDVRALTETGSTTGSEDTDGNPSNCTGQVNTTFNSCMA